VSSDEALGLAERLRRLADNALATAQNRLRLLSVEVEAEALRLGAALFNIVLAALFVGFGLLSLAVFVTVLLWDSHRLLALGINTALFFGLTAWTANNAYRRLTRGKSLFQDSVAEIERDREALGAGRDDAGA
jgi:uncharacterized membrane protein YqjE